MASLPARVWRKFTSPVSNTPDPSKVGSDKWNQDLNVFLGTVCNALAQLDLSADKLAYFTDGQSAALTSLTSYGRLLLAANDNAAARTLLGTLNVAGDTMTGALNMGGTNKVTGLAAPTDSTDAANKAYVDALAAVVSGALVFKGGWDASAGTFPTTTGRKTGWFYKVSVAGTVNGVSFSVGDDLFAIVDTASGSTYAANWLKIEGSITLAEVQAAVGFTFGSLAAAATITASLISDASANGRSFITAANYAAMKVLLAVAQADVAGLTTTDNPTFAGIHLVGSTSGHPWLKRNGAKLQARLGDDSAFSTIEVATQSPGDSSNNAASTKYTDDAVAAVTGGGNVTLTGDQTVAGVKTFSSIPVGPNSDPSTSNQLTRKSYVDTLDGANAKLTGNQTIGGTKTFSAAPKYAADPAGADELCRKSYVDAQGPTAGDGISVSGKTVNIKTNNFGGIGSYVLGFSAGSITEGGTIAGSSIDAASINVDGTTSPGSALAGTWRVLGNTGSSITTLFQREA